MHVARPIIPVGLTPKDRSWPLQSRFALVDSVSDWCLFHEDIGVRLGIDVHRGEPRGFLGVEQVPMTAHFHDVGLMVGDVRVTIRAGFVTGLRFPYGILGQAGFFDRFVVTMSSAPPRPYIEVLTRH